MNIWLHVHIVTATDTSPELWELAEIQTDASVQTMPLQGCRTFSTASHIHVIHVWGVWTPSQIVDRRMASHSHRYHHRCFPRFVRVGWNPSWCKCKPCHFALVDAVEPFKLHPMSMSYIYEVFGHLLRLWMGICLYIYTVSTTDASQALGKVAEFQNCARLQTMLLWFGWDCWTFQTASFIYVIHS